MNHTDGNRLILFSEKFGRLTKGRHAGKPIALRVWQRDLLFDLMASQARRAYVQMPRKNGKSLLGALIALYGLCADGENGAEVYSVAGSREQAGIVFNEAKRIIELGPLSKSLKVYRNEIIHPASSSRYKALAAEAGLHEGLNPSLVIFDELHVQGSRRELYDVMTLGSGAREHPLIVSLTTPGVRWGQDGRDSLAWSFYDYAKRIQSGEIEDPDFFFRIFEAPSSLALDDEAAWAEANPGLGDFLSAEDMRAALRMTPENEFRTKRLGQWVAAHEAWLPAGALEACRIVSSAPEAGTRVVLGFDGSRSRDATALVGATIEKEPRVFVVRVWERPQHSPFNWTVPRAEVTAVLRDACQLWRVEEVAIDPNLWLSEAQEWQKDGLPIVEFPQSASRMVPAIQRFFEAVKQGSLVWDGDKTLQRHLGNAVIKVTGMIAKDHTASARKIDAGVSAVMAFDRASVLGAKERPAIFVR